MDIIAIEPSIPMVALGRQIEKVRCENGMLRIKWLPRLPNKYSVERKGQRKHMMVIASYVLSEIEQTDERRRLVRNLWERCADLLILIEPGTPSGSSNIIVIPIQLKNYKIK